MHENDKGYTWSRRNPVRKQARLDFFLVNENIFPYVHDTSIIPGFRTDHSSILLKLKLYDNERGRGYWKLNNSLLKDRKYVQIVKETINEVKLTYINHNQDTNVSDENIIFDINDQLFLETLLLIIRGKTIQYSLFKKKKSQEEENKLESEIKVIEDEIYNNLINMSEERLQEYERKKNTLNEIRNEKTEGIMLRSRSRYEELGEKPTKYFLQLENRNYTNKVINKLVDENGNEFNDTKNILNCQLNFYKNLYDDTNLVDDTPLQNILGENPSKLSDLDSSKLEGEITYAELSTALRNMQNNKSPGLDGFTVEFF